MFIFLFCFGFLFCLHSPQPLVVLKDTVLTDVDFYEKISKDDWDSFDLDKKGRVFNDFLKNELGYYDAIKKGVHLNPKTIKSLDIRKKQILLNNTYEHLIARPRVDLNVIEKNKVFLKNKVEAYHLLIGYFGSTQNTESTISQQEAKTLIDSLYSVILLESKTKNLETVFKNHAAAYSIDPSAQQNMGFLGWVPWGRTVMSFQEPLFNLPVNSLSKPIHTEYGYHLTINKGVSFSSHYYYSEERYNDLAVKLAQGSLSFDSLKSASSAFDSLNIKNASLNFNNTTLESFVSFVLKKQQEKRLVGNKNQLVDWIDFFPEKKVLFTKHGEGFGLGWLKRNLSDAPSSRVPKIKDVEGLKDLILFFVLQEEIIKLGYTKNIHKTVSFQNDWLNNKKNIVYSDYLSFLVNSVTPIDSSLVIKEYKKQSLEKKLLKPERVVFSEIRVFKKFVAEAVLEKLENGVLFDSLLIEYGGGIKEPASKTKQTPLVLSLFLKNVGDVSEIIKNNDGSFSIARVERFLNEELFSLDLVYEKIEREITTSLQDSVKTFLLEGLLNKTNPLLFREVIGL